MTTINLRKALFFATGVEPDIGGGYGKIESDPIQILEKHDSLAVDLERSLTLDLAVFYGLWEAEIGNVSLSHKHGRWIDEIEIIYTDKEGNRKSTMMYFDVTIPHENIGKTIADIHGEEGLRRLQHGKYANTMIPVTHFFPAMFYALNHRASNPVEFADLKLALDLETDEEAKEIISRLDDCGFEVAGSE